MSRMMLLGALRAPIMENSFFDVLQLKGRAKEAADVIEAQDRLLALVNTFTLGEFDDYHLNVERRGEDTWAVCWGACVLTIDGTFEYEPSPSNRAEDFLSRTRFTLEEAFSRAQAQIDKRMAQRSGKATE